MGEFFLSQSYVTLTFRSKHLDLYPYQNPNLNHQEVDSQYFGFHLLFVFTPIVIKSSYKSQYIFCNNYDVLKIKIIKPF